MKNYLILNKTFIEDGEGLPVNSLSENRNREKSYPPGCERKISTSSIGSVVSCISAASAVTVTDNDSRIEHTRKPKAESKEMETTTLQKDDIELTELMKLIQMTATKMEETSARQKNVNMTVKRGIKRYSRLSTLC